MIVGRGELKLRGQVDFLEREARAQIRRLCIASGHLPISLRGKEPSPLIIASLDLFDESVSAGFGVITKAGRKRNVQAMALISVWLAYGQLMDQGIPLDPKITKTKLRKLIDASATTVDVYQRKVTKLVGIARLGT